MRCVMLPRGRRASSSLLSSVHKRPLPAAAAGTTLCHPTNSSPNWPSARSLASLILPLAAKQRNAAEAFGDFELAASLRLTPQIHSCNALLRQMVDEGCDLHRVLFVYKEMVKAAVAPDVVTLNCLLQALLDAGRIDAAVDQYRRMPRKGCVPNERTYETMVSGLCSRGRLEDAMDILREMMLRANSDSSPPLDCDCDFYGKVVPLLCAAGRVEEAMRLFGIMRASSSKVVPNCSSTLIHCLCQNGRVDDARKMFDEMSDHLALAPQLENLYVDLVSAYCRLGRSDDALDFLDAADPLTQVDSTTAPYQVLVRCLCEQGRIPEAVAILTTRMVEMGATHSSSSSWNTVLRALCERGDARKSLGLLARIVITSSSYTPDQATYSALIIGHCKMERIECALECFRHVRANNLSLDSESYSDLIDGLCRAEKMEEASQVLRYMSREGGGILRLSSLESLIRSACLTKRVSLNEAVSMRSRAFCSGTASTSDIFAAILQRLLELNGSSKHFLVILAQILVEGCILDSRAYCLFMEAFCAHNSGMPREIALLFDQMISSCVCPDSALVNMVLSCMSKHSQLHLLACSLEKLMDKDSHGHIIDSATLNMIISGLLKEGRRCEASKFLDMMLEKGWIPDTSTHALIVGHGAGELVENSAQDEVTSILEEGLQNY